MKVLQAAARADFPLRHLVLAVASVCAGAVQAQDTVRSAPVVVSGTRVERSSFDLPMAIDQISGDQLRDGRLGVNLSETLAIIPGVVANNRQNYAQDLQISIRGFGSRATFGVRGVRLYADGIPLTMPDGQGQAANIDLMTAKSIEVLRGPFSALYGNSSGGVISAYTEDGPRDFTVNPYFAIGSYDTTRYGVKLGGTQGIVNFTFNMSRFDSQGYRDWSAVTRDTANAKLTITPDEYSKYTLVMNYLMQPDTQDPQGITRIQYDQNPTQVGVVSGSLTSRDFRVRKSIDNMQAGLVYDRRLSANDSIRALVYAGDRQVTQYLGLTAGAQSAPRSNGGVIDLDRQFAGVDLRWSHKNEIAAMPLTVTVGLNYDQQEEARKGFENFVGSTLGVAGNLRRNETNKVSNFDQYVQGELGITDKLSASAGLRRSSVRFSSRDSYIVTNNPDDSGSVTFSKITPVAGLLYKVTPILHAYASVGRGFETPTFAELAYRTSEATGAGINTDLKPNTTTNMELGVKSYVGDFTRVNAAVFQAKSDNEITAFTNTGGRAIFQNVGRTTRRGLELSVDSQLPSGLYALGAFTYLTATFDQAFQACEVTLCPGTNPRVPVPAGNFIPGIPRYSAYGEVGWKDLFVEGLGAALEARRVGRVFVNDRNTESADAYNVFSARIGITVPVSGVKVTGFARVDNLLDTKYVGSVIVNDTSRRFYEPAPGRNILIGLSASVPF
jgi:iron complex outermembrane receptor protein